MCNACGYPAAKGHWTEAGADSPGDRLRARFARSRLLDRVLRPYGLTAHDGGLVTGIQVGTLAGGTTIVPDLGAVWAEAERLLGRPIDPLGPEYLNDDEYLND